MTFGPTPRRILPPIQGTIPIFGIEYEVYRLFAAAFAILALVGFFLFLNRTKIGTWMRAVRHDRDTAIAMGVPAQRVYAFTFALGFALAAARRRRRRADHHGRVPQRRRHPAVLLHGRDHRRARQSAGDRGGSGPARRAWRA